MWNPDRRLARLAGKRAYALLSNSHLPVGLNRLVGTPASDLFRVGARR